MVMILPDLLTKLWKSLLKVLSVWLTRTEWTGCIPIAVRLLNAAPSTGDINSAKQLCRFEDLYKSVKTGVETKRVLDSTSSIDYKDFLEIELKEMRESELWTAGATVRK